MISFDDAKYMFNAGEGTVRSQTHSESNRRRMKALFLSQLSLERAGGIPGLLMTVADASSINDLKIVGPTGLTYRLAAGRLYTFRDNLRVDPVEIPYRPAEEPFLSSSSPIFKDHNITVYAQPLSTPPQSSSDDLNTETDASLKRKCEPSPEPPRKRSKTDAQSAPTLAHLMSAPGFKPTLLPEDKADEWRRLIIERMFPATRAKLETSGSPKKDAATQGTRKKGKAGKGAKSEPTKSEHAQAIPEDKESGNFDEYRRSRSSPSAVSYVIVGPRVRGKFDVKKSIALGVPNGPLRGRLTKGDTVTFTVKDTVAREDGTSETVDRTVTVKPEECMGESEPPTAAIVLDVPSPEYISSLLQYYRKDFDPLFSMLRSTDPEHRKEVQVRALFHLVGDGVLEDPRYIDFMRGFGDDAQHVVASKEHCPNSVTFTSAAANQLRLSKLDPVIFPLQKFQMESRRRLADIPNLPPNTHLMVSNLNIRIRPPAPPAKNPNAITNDYFHPLLEKMTPTDTSIPVELSTETQNKFVEAQQLTEKIERAILKSGVTKPGDDVVVIPLGTGSAVPGKYRTVSSTLIQIPNWGNILLDAGEGTYYQLARHFGEDGARDVLRDLKCLFVSHAHADHHMGVGMLLRKRLELDPQPAHPLYLVTIRTVHLSLREMQALEYLGIQDISPSESMEPDSGNGVIPIMSEALHFKRPGVYTYSGPWGIGGTEPWLDVNRSTANAAALCQSLGLDKMSTVDMIHGTKCYGLVLSHHEGWSIVFSGDTESSENLVQAGQGATLLIHEATMADDQVDLAKAKKHSTFGQAIDIGRRMKAEKILLTHFSARHPKVPMTLLELNSASSSCDASASSDAAAAAPSLSPSSSPIVALAFDQASMRIGDMWKMQYYLEALEQIEKDTVAVEGEDEDEVGRLNVEVSV
ncbi:hypothetical protein EST38_g1005 [Candolleomyces aberdarensis]|uniref:ribonuclease Z n=1 Tax=Candolleomyces aberdarensis TaxID=2316362 RepID=A0A4V1Q599_9AGAR|nr:hypothetical protein EST38_g1005 [Candolleomyces aberdarensis]